MGTFEYYLISINIVGMLAYLLNMFLYRFTPNRHVDPALTVISLLGGSAGIIIIILLFDRKPEKENMMSRVFVASVFVIQLVLVLFIYGFHADKISIDFPGFFASHKILLVYLGVINLITFVAFAIDKINAIRHKHRIPIITLLGLAFIGGSVGAILGMYLLRHKIRKDYFTVGVPLIMLMQVVVILFAMTW